MAAGRLTLRHSHPYMIGMIYHQFLISPCRTSMALSRRNPANGPIWHRIKYKSGLLQLIGNYETSISKSQTWHSLALPSFLPFVSLIRLPLTLSYSQREATPLANLAIHLDTAFSTRYGKNIRHQNTLTNHLQDINNSGDGGIYAELIQNRAFQGTKKYPASTAHYSPINGASLSLEKLKDPLSKIHPWSMRVAATADSKGDIGFKNHGYWGIGVSRQTYTGSFWVQGPYSGSFTVSLESNLTGEVFGTTKVASRGRMWDWQATWIWTEYTFHLVPSKDAPNSNNSFSITFDPAATTSGWLDFGYISLFPPTYKNRKNGLRLDLAEALADMNPVSWHRVRLLLDKQVLTHGADFPSLSWWKHA